MPIGVFDSGLGGLTVLRALRAALPNQSFVYFGDNAAAPYGERSADEVFALTSAGVARLQALGCGLVILACNTASALALRRIQQEWLPPRAPHARVLGVFVPIVEAITGRDWWDVALGAEAGAAAAATPRGAAPDPPRKRVVVFATPGTVASGAFEREAASRAPWLDVASVACPGLVDAIEADDFPAAETLVAEAVARSPAIAPEAAAETAVVLGCTHYPLVEAAFRRALAPGVEIMSQSSVTAASLARYLARRPQFEDRLGRLSCLTTGDPAAISARAGGFFGRPIAFEAA